MRLVLSELSADTAGALRTVVAEIAILHPNSHVVSAITDVTDPQARDALIARALEHHGRLDVSAHATAISQRFGPTVVVAPDEWDRIMVVNAKGS